MIDTIVVSGGGPNGVAQLGIIQTMIEKGHLDIAQVKHCYCVSAGSMLTCLMFFAPIKDIADYVTTRPWKKWMKADFELLTDGKGLCDGNRFKEVLEPFFKAYDVPMDITFQQYHERFGVDLHINCTNVRTFNKRMFQRSTDPDMAVTLAVCMSSALYPIFTPIEYGDSFYMDGGFSDNFPVEACFLDGCDPAKTLTLTLIGQQTGVDIPEGGINFLTYLFIGCMIRLQNHAVNMAAAEKAKYNMMFIGKPTFNVELWEMFLDDDPSPRKKLFDDGCSAALTFLENFENENV